MVHPYYSEEYSQSTIEGKLIGEYSHKPKQFDFYKIATFDDYSYMNIPMSYIAFYRITKDNYIQVILEFIKSYLPSTIENLINNPPTIDYQYKFNFEKTFEENLLHIMILITKSEHYFISSDIESEFFTPEEYKEALENFTI